MKKNLHLNERRLAALTETAKKHNAFCRSGKKAEEPSWQELVRLIADGYLVVTKPGQSKEYSKKSKYNRTRKPFKAWPKYPPKWWKPNYMGTMSVDDAVKASGFSAEELETGGLPKLGEDFFGLEEWARLIPEDPNPAEEEFEEVDELEEKSKSTLNATNQ